MSQTRRESPAAPPVAEPRHAVRGLRDRPHAQVLIVGGGINGIATLRELALQGIDAALIEQHDFVSGASAASSHMVHGGVRYLENGELRLVREAVQERNRLIRNAPHVVTPLQTTIPIFSTFSGLFHAPFRLLVTHGRGRPRERGALLIKIGLTLYDTFSRGGGRMPRHRFHGRHRSLRELPDLDPRVAYTATYFDASMHSPERLAIDVLADALAAGSGDQSARTTTATEGNSDAATRARSRAANYVSLAGIENGTALLRDEVSGETFDFSADLIVNTTGNWADLTNERLGHPTSYMGGTKGSHIVLDHPELLRATRGREIFFEHSDGRIVLIYPLKGRVLVGTTDIEANGETEPVCTDAEISYFQELIAHVFPEIRVDRSQIVFTFSGVRPLPKHDDTSPGFVSRDYRIEHTRVGGTPLATLVGGKWTTFRASAEHLADEVLGQLYAPRLVHTRATAIGGGAGFPRDRASRRLWLARNRGPLSSADAGRLLDRYGTRAAELIRTFASAPKRLSSLPDYFADEVRGLARAEHVVHLDDLVLRRSSLGFEGHLQRSQLEELAQALASELGWDTAQQADEVERTVTLLRARHRIDVDSDALADVPSAAGATTGE